MKNEKIAVSILLTGLVWLVFACGGAGKQASPDLRSAAAGGLESLQARRSGSGYNDEASYWGGEISGGNTAQAAKQAVQGPEPGAEQIRKLVRRAELRIRAEDPGALEKPLDELMQKYGAWASSTSIRENSRDYSLRVPYDSYDAMLEDLIGLGKLLHRSESAEDVTLNYYDLEGRLATKKELLTTYQGYLGKAKNIEEIMTVEQKIAELQQDIDWTGTQLRNLAHLVDYATIEFEVSGPTAASPYAAPTLKERFGGLLRPFGEIASGVLVALTGVIIYGVPGLLVLTALFWIFFGKIGLIRRLWRLASGKGKAKN
jgi:hypothetical protein